MDYHFDRVSVFRGLILIEGWSSIGMPTLAYDDDVECATHCNGRAQIDEHRESFRICGVTAATSLRHESIVVSFPNGLVLRNPGAASLASADQPYRDMMARFARETDRGGRLLEIGSRARSGNVHRHLFSPSVDYVGLDIKEGPNVDVVGDAHELRHHVGANFDFAFSTAVFEHLLMPWKVAIEMGHVLNMGGVALVASHACFPLHEEPWDFWRYSRNAWKGLFNSHTGFEVLDAQYAVACSIVSEFAPGQAMQDIELCPNFVLSACLVRKISEPRVDWQRPAAEVYDLAYDH